MSGTNERQNSILSERGKKHFLILWGCMILMIYFGARLVTRESPENWKEAEVTLTEVRHVTIKPNLWEITDTEGNTYSMSESDNLMKQIQPQSTYSIIYSPAFNNGIRAMTQEDRVIVDYEQSVLIYGKRSVWDWILGLGGFTGWIVMVVKMCREARKKRNHERQKQESTAEGC